MTCLFCRIAAHDEQTPASIVWEDDQFCAFLDIHPVFRGHVLLVPRTHVVTLPELSADLAGGFIAAAQRLAQAVIDGLGAQGSWVSINNTVSQSVPHLHLHVIPRTRGDGLKGFFWPRVRYRDAAEQEEYAARLRAVLGPGPSST